MVIWHALPMPSVGRTIAMLATIFSLLETTANALPLHPRGDGTVALRALLWLIDGHEPNRFFVLYLWRPIILIAVGLLTLASGGIPDIGSG